MFPTIAEYNQTIQARGGSAFTILSNLTFIPSRTSPVKIFSYGSGSYAVVFKAKDRYSEYAIRCFISAESENIDRYRKIDSYLRNINASWVTKTELLENEINVRDQYYPVIKMDWVEGQLLNNFITQHIGNNSILTGLQNEVINVSRSLENERIGHGDIQCGNIIISKDKNGQNILKLIDYDGMYIPAFSRKTNLERGRSEFQHPRRHEIEYNEEIDRFSFWVLLCAFEALKFDKTLWNEIMSGGFNTLDNLLFTGADFSDFNNSRLVQRLYALNKPSISFYLNKLRTFCQSSPNSVEPPTIFNSNEQTVDPVFIEPSTRASNTEIDIRTNPTGAAVLNSTFQKIGVTPIQINKESYVGHTLTLAYGTQFKQIQITNDTSRVRISFIEPESPNPILISPDSESASQIEHTSTPSSTDYSSWFILAVLLVAVVIIVAVFNSTNSGTTASSMSVDSSVTFPDSTVPQSGYANINSASDSTSGYRHSEDNTTGASADTTALSSESTIAANSSSERGETISFKSYKNQVLTFNEYTRSWQSLSPDYTEYTFVLDTSHDLIEIFSHGSGRIGRFKINRKNYDGDFVCEYTGLSNDRSSALLSFSFHQGTGTMEKMTVDWQNGTKTQYTIDQ